ncbi:MAG: DUF2752 domain-containing protein [Candidatus Eisenbacteria bacterium]|nr:DUF2752 domain-containing protein [Candidatus Eisenbacteria bacterium]
MKIGDRRWALRSGGVPLEAVVWAASLAFLFWIGFRLDLTNQAAARSAAPDLCLAHRLGIPFCPGCGLGRSIALALHGRLIDSFLAHPLGLPALAILLRRIAHLLCLTGRRSTEIVTEEWRATGGRVAAAGSRF